MNTVTREQAIELIKGTGGKTFVATFRKRTDDTFRRMICRLGVKKGVTGTGMAYKPEDYDLKTVWDFEKKAFRHISLDRLISLKIEGEEYVVGEEK